MPKYVTKSKKSVKITKRRKFVKKTQLRPVNRSMVKFGLGLPKKVMCTHKYHEYIQMVSTSGSLFSYAFRANGMYDPNATGSGHQPIFFDQISAIYNHYCVIGSKIKLRVTNAIAGNSMTSIDLYLNDDTTVTPTSDGLSEQTSSRSRQIPFGSTDNHYMGLTFSAKKVFGGSVLGNSNLRGNISADPAEQSVFQIVGFCPNLGSSTLNIEVMIEYTAIWTELKDIAQS